MNAFGELLNDTLQRMEHHVLNIIEAINKFSFIASKYKDKISINNRIKRHKTLQFKLSHLCDCKFTELIKNDVEPALIRGINQIIDNETLVFAERQSEKLKTMNTLISQHIHAELNSD